MKSFVFICLMLFVIGFLSSAAEFVEVSKFGYNNLDGPILSPAINYSELPTVNASEFWITNIGSLSGANATQFNNLNSILNIDELWVDSLWCRLTGCIFSGDTNYDGNDILDVGNITAENYFGNISETTLGYGDETIKELFDDTLNRGILDSFTITDTGGLNFNWTSGEIYDESTKSIIDISAGSGSCTNNAVNYLKWVSGTTLTISTVKPTSPEIGIAVISCQANDIWFIQLEDILNEREVEMSNGMAAIHPETVIDGLIVSEDTNVTSPWDIVSSAGSYIIDGHQTEQSSLRYSRLNNLTQWFHVGGVYTATSSQTINTTHWDDGTNPVLVSVPKYYRGNFCFLDNETHWIMATEEFDTIAQALAGECPARPPGIQNCVRSTCLILKGSATVLPPSGSDQWADVRPLSGRSETGTVTDHGNLAGLSDDDHTQYLLTDGSKNITGSLTIEENLEVVENITASYGFFDFIVGDGSKLNNVNESSWNGNFSNVAFTNVNETFDENLICVKDFLVDTNTFFVDSINNRVGIGTISPDVPFHVEAVADSREEIAKFTVSDDADNYLQIENGGSIAGQFNPTMLGFSNKTASPGLNLWGTIDTSVDSGSVAVFHFDAFKGASTPIATRPIFKIRNFGTVLMQGNPNGDILIPTGDLIISGSMFVGNNTNGGLSDGDINVSTIYYDVLTAKSPSFLCSNDWCSVSFPEYQKTLWLQKDDNWTILDIVYEDNSYTKQEFNNQICSINNTIQEICSRLNQKIKKLQDKIIADRILKEQREACNYSWDVECFEIIKTSSNYTSSVSSKLVNIIYQETYSCQNLNDKLIVVETYCTRDIVNGTRQVWGFNENCGWDIVNSYWCEERVLR